MKEKMKMDMRELKLDIVLRGRSQKLFEKRKEGK